MSNKALIEDLRGWAWQELAATTYGDGILNRAADTIEQLESERDDLDERLNERYSRCNSLEAENTRLREAIINYMRWEGLTEQGEGKDGLVECFLDEWQTADVQTVKAEALKDE